MEKSFTPGSGKSLSFDDSLIVEDVLEAAAEWKAGRLPLTDAVKVGEKEVHGQVSTGFARFMAITKTPKSDPRWSALYDMVRTLDTMQGGIITRQGRYDRYEVQQTIRHNDELFSSGKIWRGSR